MLAVHTFDLMTLNKRHDLGDSPHGDSHRDVSRTLESGSIRDRSQRLTERLRETAECVQIHERNPDIRRLHQRCFIIRDVSSAGVIKLRQSHLSLTEAEPVA